MGDGGHGLDGGGARAALSALWGVPSAVGRSFVCVCVVHVCVQSCAGCVYVCGVCVCVCVWSRLAVWPVWLWLALVLRGVWCVVHGGVGWAPWLELTSVAVSITVVV